MDTLIDSSASVLPLSSWAPALCSPDCCLGPTVPLEVPTSNAMCVRCIGMPWHKSVATKSHFFQVVCMSLTSTSRLHVPDVHQAPPVPAAAHLRADSNEKIHSLCFAPHSGARQACSCHV
jgi:hypothetical protein